MPATLTLDYGITITSDWGNWGMVPFITLYGGHGVEQTKLSVPASGSLSFDISPGQNYTLQLYDGSNLNVYLPAFTSEMVGTFSFEITPAPEPGTLALLGLAVAAAFSIHTRKTGAYKNPR